MPRTETEHVVTAVEAVGECLITELAPLLIAMKAKDPRVQIASTIFEVGSVGVSLIEAFGVDIGAPSLSAGQYYRIATWAANGIVFVEFKMWISKQSYEQGQAAACIYTANTATRVPDFN